MKQLFVCILIVLSFTYSVKACLENLDCGIGQCCRDTHLGKQCHNYVEEGRQCAGLGNVYTCGCGPGLWCERGIMESVGWCHKQPQLCMKDNDCPKNHCCKEVTSSDLWVKQNHCMKYIEKGQSCEIYARGHEISCGCVAGSKCSPAYDEDRNYLERRCI